MRRLVNFLENKPTEFDEIHVSLDSHTKTHIAHLGFWQLRPEQESELKAYGVVGFRLNPEPTGAEEINAEKVNIELYNMKTAETIPGYENIMPRGVVTINGVEKQIDQNQLKKLAVDYINKLTQLHNIYNKPLPTTWPDHCIIGTKGWRIYEPLASVLNSKFKGKVYIHEKGTNDLVEMYSIFKAEVPYPDLYPRNIVNDYKDATVPKPNTTVNDPNTNRNYATTLNKDFITQLRGANNENIVYVCGEAKTHCVKTSAEDLVGDNGKNVIMLYNVMSDITDPDIYVEPRKKVFGELKDKGVEFAQIIEGVIVMVDDYDPNNDNPEIPPQQ
jgi:nicotinamidase-related amidase